MHHALHAPSFFILSRYIFPISIAARQAASCLHSLVTSVNVFLVPQMPAGVFDKTAGPFRKQPAGCHGSKKFPCVPMLIADSRPGTWKQGNFSSFSSES
jgi:hypothetical protein